MFAAQFSLIFNKFSSAQYNIQTNVLCSLFHVGVGDLMKVKHSSNSRGDSGAYIIASAGAFSDYLMSTAAENDVIIIDAERHRMQCQWHGAGHVSAIVGVKVI